MQKWLVQIIIASVGFIHLVSLSFFYFYIHSDKAEKTQTAFYWVFWGIIDMPISFLLAIDGFFVILRKALFAKSAETVYLFFHGVFGTIWWMCIAYFLCLLVNFLFFKK